MTALEYPSCTFAAEISIYYKYKYHQELLDIDRLLHVEQSGPNLWDVGART